jgi:hypothetical protein
MDARTQLALLVKAKRVFEAEDTFLSFPVLSAPVSHPPEKLRFNTPDVDLGVLAEFSLAANALPHGAIYPLAVEDHLWDVYAGLFPQAELAQVPESPQEAAAYAAADAVLHTGSGADRQDTEAYRAYKAYRDAWIAAQEAYKAGQLDAGASSDPATQTAWRDTEEPALRQKVKQAELDLETLGHRAEIEEAEAAVRAHAARMSPSRIWDDWRTSFDPLVDTLTDPVTGQAFAPTAFSPSDPFSTDWPTFTLTSDEIAKLVSEAPAELSQLDLGSAGDNVVKVSFQFRSVVLNRPWMRPEVFRARFWRLRQGGEALSDGGSPPTGRLPAYPVAAVFVRNIVETTRSAGGGQVENHPIRAFQALTLRSAVLASTAGSVLATKPSTAVEAGAAGGATGTALHMAAVRDFPLPAAREGEEPSLLARDHRLGTPQGGTLETAVVTDHRTAPGVPAGAAAMKVLKRFDLSELRVVGVLTKPPPPPPQEESTPPSPDVSVLAYVCKQLPRCPDPDPALSWPGT